MWQIAFKGGLQELYFLPVKISGRCFPRKTFVYNFFKAMVQRYPKSSKINIGQSKSQASNILDHFETNVGLFNNFVTAKIEIFHLTYSFACYRCNTLKNFNMLFLIFSPLCLIEFFMSTRFSIEVKYWKRNLNNMNKKKRINKQTKSLKKNQTMFLK